MPLTSEEALQAVLGGGEPSFSFPDATYDDEALLVSPPDTRVGLGTRV